MITLGTRQGAFSVPANNVGDAIRLVCFVVGAVVFGQLVGRARTLFHFRAGAYFRSAVTSMYIALAAYDVSVIFTEVGRLGHIVTWRLPVNVVGLTFTCVALAKIKDAERATGMRFGEMTTRRLAAQDWTDNAS